MGSDLSVEANSALVSDSACKLVKALVYSNIRRFIAEDGLDKAQLSALVQYTVTALASTKQKTVASDALLRLCHLLVDPEMNHEFGKDLLHHANVYMAMLKPPALTLAKDTSEQVLTAHGLYTDKDSVLFFIVYSS